MCGLRRYRSSLGSSELRINERNLSFLAETVRLFFLRLELPTVNVSARGTDIRFFGVDALLQIKFQKIFITQNKRAVESNPLRLLQTSPMTVYREKMGPTDVNLLERAPRK